MVGRVLTKNRGITTREGDTYSLIGADELSDQQRKDLMPICDEPIEAYLEARGEAIGATAAGHRPISGSSNGRYLSQQVRAVKCAACQSDERALEVDHIEPKELGWEG